MAQNDKPEWFWRKTRLITGWLLALWFCLTFVAIFFARELASVTVSGWPFSFYLAAQGLPLLYLGIVGLYAVRMHRLERLLKKESDQGTPHE